MVNRSPLTDAAERKTALLPGDGTTDPLKLYYMQYSALHFHTSELFNEASVI